MTVDDYAVGVGWTYVRCGGHMGIARTVNEARFPMEIVPEPGMPIDRLSQAVLSWNYQSAGLGLAAMNTAFNNERYIKLRHISCEYMEYGALVDRCRGVIADKRSAFIEYPFTINTPMLRGAKVSVLKHRPEDGDFPLSAAEYILPDQDRIFISGRCIISKTLPRLLALDSGDLALLADADIPVGLLKGENPISRCVSFIVQDCEKCAKLIKTAAEDQEIFGTGVFIYAKNQ